MELTELREKIKAALHRKALQGNDAKAAAIIDLVRADPEIAEALRIKKDYDAAKDLGPSV